MLRTCFVWCSWSWLAITRTRPRRTCKTCSSPTPTPAGLSFSYGLASSGDRFSNSCLESWIPKPRLSQTSSSVVSSLSVASAQWFYRRRFLRPAACAAGTITEPASWVRGAVPHAGSWQRAKRAVLFEPSSTRFVCFYEENRLSLVRGTTQSFPRRVRRHRGGRVAVSRARDACGFGAVRLDGPFQPTPGARTTSLLGPLLLFEERIPACRDLGKWLPPSLPRNRSRRKQTPS